MFIMSDSSTVRVNILYTVYKHIHSCPYTQFKLVQYFTCTGPSGT